MKRLRVGVIGQGRSGYSIHVHSLGLMQDRFGVAAVCDPIEERTSEAAQEHGARRYTDYNDLLAQDDLDLVVVSTPSHLRVPAAAAAFEAGRNVLCEKPLARRASEVDGLIALAKKKDCFFAVYQQSRYAPYFQQVQKVIASGVLGRIVMVKINFNGYSRRWDWQTLQEFGAGSLLNTGPHPVDQALCLLNWKKPDVFCLMDRANVWGDAEDHVKVIMTGKNLPTIDLEISSCCAYPENMYQIYGTQGGLSGGSSGLKWRYFKPKESPKQKLIRTPLPGPSYCRETLKWYEKEWAPTKEQRDGFTYMSKLFYNHLYKVLREGAPLQMKLEQVGVQVAVMEECHRQCSLSKMRPKGWPKGN